MTDNKRPYGSGIGIAIGMLLALYFFLPTVFCIPILAAVKHRWISEANLDRIAPVFTPLELLGQAFPPYKAMLQKEWEIWERMGLIPSMDHDI